MPADENKKIFKKELSVLLAELFGTFALTFTAAGVTIVASLTNEVDHFAKVTAPGLMVMAMIYTLGDQSGAHINPVVTLAFALRRAFPWIRLPGYWFAQFIGAALAALLLHFLFGDIEHLGAAMPHSSAGQAFTMEIILTLFLLTVIIGTATEHKVVGPNAGISVGGTIVLCGILGSPISGASMNPAASFGPRLIGGEMQGYWIYLIGPIIGSALAVFFNGLTHGRPSEHERKTASGKSEKTK